MTYTVNLLPWRIQRQTRCRNVWSAIFAGTLIVILLTAFACRQVLQAERQMLALIAQADAALLNAFATQKQQWQALEKQRQTNERHEKQRQATRHWQHALMHLAGQMPDHAWLTGLRYQQGKLELAGYATSFDALAKFESGLKALPGFHAGKAGSAARDAEGRWQFSHQLIKDDANEPRP